MRQDPDSDSIRRAVDAIAAQLHCDKNDALQALLDVAAAAETDLADVADYIVEGAVRFDA
jgi:hypothetical protein